MAMRNCEYLCCALYQVLYNYSKPSPMFVNKKTAVWGKHNTRRRARYVNVWQRSSSTNWNSRYWTNNAEMVRRWRISDRKVRGLAPRPRRHRTRKTPNLLLKPSKCHLIVKQASLSKARTIFHGTVIIFTDWLSFLGSAIEYEKASEPYTEEKADEYNKICMKIFQPAKTLPQYAYFCLT